MAKPVVASSIGGIPELIIDNITGYLYEYDNINELAKNLEKMFNSNNYKELCENAKKIAQNRFSKEKYYNELIKIYNEVLSRNEQVIKQNN